MKRRNAGKGHARKDNWQKCQEERKVQIDLMKALLEGVTLNSVPSQLQPNINFRKFTEADDIGAYLTTFEKFVTSEQLGQQHWAFKLVSYLTSKAQQVYVALSIKEAADYTKLKEAILHKYNVTVDSYCQQFRSTLKKHNESYQELVIRLGHLVQKWLKDCTTVEAIPNQVVLEQLLYVLPKNMGIALSKKENQSPV